MVSTITSNSDEFVSWIYQLTHKVATHAGISEKQASAAINTIIADVQAEWGGSSVYIRSPRAAKIHQQKASVIALRKQGLLARQIARQLGLSETNVYRILSNHKHQSKE